MIVSEVMSPPDCHAEPTTQHGTWFLSGRHVFRLGIEGIVSKRSPYRSGRTSDWCGNFWCINSKQRFRPRQ